jgi:hypothetical protein
MTMNRTFYLTPGGLSGGGDVDPMTIDLQGAWQAGGAASEPIPNVGGVLPSAILENGNVNRVTYDGVLATLPASGTNDVHASYPGLSYTWLSTTPFCSASWVNMGAPAFTGTTSLPALRRGSVEIVRPYLNAGLANYRVGMTSASGGSFTHDYPISEFLTDTWYLFTVHFDGVDKYWGGMHKAAPWDIVNGPLDKKTMSGGRRASDGVNAPAYALPDNIGGVVEWDGVNHRLGPCYFWHRDITDAEIQRIITQKAIF